MLSLLPDKTDCKLTLCAAQVVPNTGSNSGSSVVRLERRRRTMTDWAPANKTSSAMPGENTTVLPHSLTNNIFLGLLERSSPPHVRDLNQPMRIT